MIFSPKTFIPISPFWCVYVLRRNDKGPGATPPHKSRKQRNNVVVAFFFFNLTMMGLSKLGTAITAVTAVTLVALAAEIVYVLWQRRQRFRPRVRVEPREASLQCSTSSSPSDDDVDLELEEHVMKWHCLHGPSRVLFTIKEEEREEVESDNGNGNVSSVECTKKAWVSERVAVEEVAVAVEELLDETTLFSTPCASPPYYTPYASPIREECRKDVNDGNG
ncbi:unnamed protein product [Sphenostylis stenocarpa]|uniref:Uncharacterized protein n=1 Tax=Sphenostylis stenocarpa TaxID=92480 RepID=A0AA86SV37_9FABA|nr:unnamed protein product [Sphenostylis stenocarpa]